MAKMNYNSWFFNQHKYHIGSREGVSNFIDNKWVNFNDRFRSLQDIHSSLLDEQPFVVNGNNVGFDKLIDLMGRSNYTFDDLDKSMKDTYRMSLQNTMSRNIVNTHAVMFHTSNLDKKNVTADKFTHYKIIDAPFNQLHFGHRDEFIRQKLSEMHNTEFRNYTSIDKFNSSEFSRILGFSIICTVNGYFCNDCLIAIDDKGFKFKAGWPYASDVDFIVYKLDHSTVVSRTLNVSDITSGKPIPYSVLNVNNDLNGMKCIVNLYDNNFIKTTPSVPNFGIFTDEGFVIRNLQGKTIETFDRQKTSTVSIDIYALKFFHEIPDLYPAVNYLDIMDTRLVYDEKYERIKTPEGRRVIASTTSNINYLETCTPPIAIDRNTTYSFDIIISCLSLYDDLIKFNNDLKDTGKCILQGTESDFFNIYKPKLLKMYNSMIELFRTYQQGAIITSLVPSNKINLFEKLLNNIKKLSSLLNFSKIQDYVFDELYGDNYRMTVNNIVEPFKSNKLSVFTDMVKLDSNYFNDDNSNRFNRAISEECFITLRYHQDDDCWLFDYPEIKHFNGIGNTFYIDTKLKGTEIFKFFVLYSDTEAPSEKEIDHAPEDIIMDFDLFMSEIDKHIGLIKYWDSENRLLKISKMLYNKYDDETCVHVLSKILKRKISGDDLIKIYPSDINYEDSNVTSDNVDEYNENTERGPFSINFLFYTLSMMNNNEDKLQSYFYHTLTNRRFNNRYSDINLSKFIDNEKYPINYSEINVAPSSLGDDTVIPENKLCAFYGLPFLINGDIQLVTPYRYVFNTYESNAKYSLIDDGELDNSCYTLYTNIDDTDHSVISYHDDIILGSLFTKYISSVYDYIATLQTDYRTSFNQSSTIESAVKTIEGHIAAINDLVNNGNIIDAPGIITPTPLINSVVVNNDFIRRLYNIRNLINSILTVRVSPTTDIFSYMNSKVINTLKFVYTTAGFDNDAVHRVRMLYDHLKKINEPMNVYQFDKWLNNIDLHILSKLDDMIADNEYYKLGKNVFIDMYNILNDYIVTIKRNNMLTMLDNEIKDLSESFRENHINPLIQYCMDAVDKVAFNMYTIDDIEFDTSFEYDGKPAYVVMNIFNSAYTTPPLEEVKPGVVGLVFKASSNKNKDKYNITSLANICDYVFFRNTKMEHVIMVAYDEEGNNVGVQQVSINFMKVSSMADKMNNFYHIPSIVSEPLEFQNNHESFEIANDLVVNEKHADMNYELLVGNHFIPLEHEIEMIMEPETWLPGSVDKVFIENQMINKMIMSDFSHYKCFDFYFKPSQVLHITPNEDGSIDSIYGKYFEGQTIYLKTTDGLSTFPAIITAVDHSSNKGFIEAKIDGFNSSWFKVEDRETIEKYFTTDIECEVLDDNIRNFIDEFTNGSYPSYINPGYDIYDIETDQYTLPGDPLYVSANSDFIYTRLNWIFNDNVPNRFINERTDKHRFIYLTNGFINNDDDVLKINMINHDFDTRSLPGKYPVLRDEPNDHYVWNQEIGTFKERKAIEEGKLNGPNKLYWRKAQAEYHLAQAKTYYDKEKYTEEINACDMLINKSEALIKRLDSYINQLERPSTWFNVLSYETSLVYIDNGRADMFSPHFVSNVRDVAYTDKVDVFLYDWEHKMWLDPSTYSVESKIVDAIKLEEYDDYTTNRILYSLTITPLEGFVNSKKLLVYLSYYSSAVFDDIEMNDTKCNVRFKPLLTLDTNITNFDPYANVYIRKHFDGYEEYKVDSTDIHIKRVERNGKYVNAPVFRVCDILIEDDNGNHTFEDIESFYVPNKFGFDITDRKLYSPHYEASIVSEIDSFKENENIKLICINNNEQVSYDGNISSVMFDAITSFNEEGNQIITIKGSTLANYEVGEFACTVFKDKNYSCVGGTMLVTVTHTEEDIFDEWIRVPNDYIKYREVPEEFKIVMKEPIDGETLVTLKNNYIRDIDDVVDEYNANLNNSYEYYYDMKKMVRYPVSNVRTNSITERLIIDPELNPNVKLIKAPYIGICRYSLGKIPENGFIDLTGYVPTPLSRDRYEFWVNGRCIKDEKNLIIMSPTTLQLCNMTSLRNFEVIELIDDVDIDNDLFKKGNIYVDINGNTFANYRLAMLNNSRIRQQGVHYIFNANNHDKIHDYVKNVVENPNNQDIEIDILSYVTFNDNVTDYDKLYNIPTINTVPLLHPNLTDIGITEIPNDLIIKEFDKVWKYEALTNPLFYTTHREGIADRPIELNVKLITEHHWNNISTDTRGMYLVYVSGLTDEYFSLYISEKSDGEIDELDSTVKIIPFVMAGVYLLIDSQYKNKWIHSTNKKIKPIRIS